MVDAGLILEGGGMRGLYTAGVLEYFMEQDLYFPTTSAYQRVLVWQLPIFLGKRVEIKR